MTLSSDRPFGRIAVAMVTPFTAGGALDLDGAQRLATHLVDEGGCDGLVLSGTTGESPTTSDAEKDSLLRAVLEAVGDRAVITAGVGTNDTRHTMELARAAEKAGAHGLLVVTPYYNKPPQEGLRQHFTAVADATGLPVMLYDIPARAGTAIATDTLLRLAEHPRIVAVKDAKNDVLAAARVLGATDLRYYCGADEFNLPLAALGAVGVVSVVGHVLGVRIREMLDAYEDGRVAEAARLNQRLAPAVTGIMTRTQGVIATKAALGMVGLPGGPVRPPLADADPDLAAAIAADLRAAGLEVAVKAA
ncbi:MAG: 4-hydroxy-tetrahydrodipicolinate synthase [Mycobacteriales bacterium]